jgi:hypothetical protein
MVWPSSRLRADIPERARRLLDWSGVLGLLTIGLVVWRTTEYSQFLYPGGFVALTLATVVVIAVLVHPAARLGRVLGAEPLRWIGVRSYGIYLWQLPIIVLTTPAGAHGVDLRRAALQVAATFAVAAISWRFVEEPVRHGALGRLWRTLAASGGRARLLARPRYATAAATLGLLATVLVLALVAESFSQPVASGDITAAGVGAGSPPPSATVLTARQGRGATAGSTRTSCRSVIDIGDSTSEGLVSPDYLPDPGQRIEAQYTRVGVRWQRYAISGARSIVETVDGQPNATEVVQRWRQARYDGCWVLAIGTNDAANMFVSSKTPALERIQQVMTAIGTQPVLWVNTKSLLTTGPYAEQNMQAWNDALVQACYFYPNMRVFDWASVAQDGWFIADGVHYDTPGYAERGRLIARALARAFPVSGTRRGCVVG